MHYMKNPNYMCWNTEADMVGNDENCPHTCERKNIEFTKPTWFGGWIESKPENCKERTFNLKNIMDLI